MSVTKLDFGPIIIRIAIKNGRHLSQYVSYLDSSVTSKVNVDGVSDIFRVEKFNYNSSS